MTGNGTHMTDTRDAEEADISVVVGAGAAQPNRPSPRLPILIAVLIALVGGSLVLGLQGSELPTHEEAINQQTPGVAVVKSFLQALSDGDVDEAMQLIDPDFVVLEFPDPLVLGSSFQATFTSSDQGWWDRRARGPGPVADQISHHLDELARLGAAPSVSACTSEIPTQARGRELYDRLVTCRVQWNDGLRERLQAGPILFTVDVGIRDDLIKGFFTESPSQTEQLYAGPVPSFLSWLAQFHPAATADLFMLTGWEWRWGAPQELRSPSAAAELLTLADIYATWTEEVETSGLPSSPVPPVRIGHALVYRASAEGVLLIEGRGVRGPPHDLWRFDPASDAWRRYPTIESGPAVSLDAVAHPSSSWVLGIHADPWSSDETPPWVWSAETLAWAELPLLPSEESWWCLDRQGVLPDYQSPGFLLVLCEGTYRFDPTTWTLIAVPGLPNEEYYAPSWADGELKLVAAAPAGEALVRAGGGRIQSIDAAAGRITTLATDGPVEVSAVVPDPASGLMIIVGDGAIWSFDLESLVLERLINVTDSEAGTHMYWRTAAAAYDEVADLVVIFDGEQTWTYDVDSSILRFVSG